ncbi:MAG TPA: VWA domain-containing protein [Pyrinomonadaceae bacterium]|nr:VWA domain-containing protein [Pyrinomonadaceae bacterium]
MSRLMKRRRSLLRRVILLTTLAAIFPGWFAASSQHAQEVSNQQKQKQRPRRVTDPNEPPPLWKLKKPDTPAAGDEVDEGDVVRVETQLVSVPAVVTDGSGRPLAGLKAENFQLIEDGQVQTITNFGTAETPFEIALLLDTSGSTRDDVALIRSAATSFIQALRPGDRVGVVAFNTAQTIAEKVATVEVLTPLTGDREALKTAIENLGSSNGTPYYDALERVADSIFRDTPRDEVRGRRAVVALTDGVDSASNSDFATARIKLSRAGIACYFIQVNTEDFVEDRLMKDCQDDGQISLSQRQIERYRRIFFPSSKAENFNSFCQMGPFERMSISRGLYNLARREMNDLAKVSGGRSFVAASLADARAAFARVAADIGTLYSLGYYPTNKARDGKYRAIKLEVRGVKDKTEVRARDGYYAPKQ